MPVAMQSVMQRLNVIVIAPLVKYNRYVARAFPTLVTCTFALLYIARFYFFFSLRHLGDRINAVFAILHLK